MTEKTMSKISNEDLRSLQSFTRGIWDAREVEEQLFGLEDRTKGVHQVDRPGRKAIWELTDVGREILRSAGCAKTIGLNDLLKSMEADCDLRPGRESDAREHLRLVKAQARLSGAREVLELVQ